MQKYANCKVFCQFEIGEYLKGKGVAADRVVQFNIGGTVDIGGGYKATMVCVAGISMHNG